MQSVCGRLREVVASESQTEGSLLRGEVWSNLLFGHFFDNVCKQFLGFNKILM